MDLDPVLLSRLQFAWVIGWHILLPAFRVGMASYIAILEGLHFVTGRDVYLRISTFWIRILSVAFGVGVVTGVVMPFQIGTNWSRYADAAGMSSARCLPMRVSQRSSLRRLFWAFCFLAESWCRRGRILWPP
jgi:cytochrome bd-type quinol oxidase subunit 1